MDIVTFIGFAIGLIGIVRALIFIGATSTIFLMIQLRDAREAASGIFLP